LWSHAKRGCDLRSLFGVYSRADGSKLGIIGP
jgi:hypothetical protein